jgi:hypothetical protein
VELLSGGSEGNAGKGEGDDSSELHFEFVRDKVEWLLGIRVFDLQKEC